MASGLLQAICVPGAALKRNFSLRSLSKISGSVHNTLNQSSLPSHKNHPHSSLLLKPNHSHGTLIDVSKRFRREEDFFRPFDIDTNVKKDTLIYKFKDDRHFFYLGLFGVVMIMFWTQLAYQANAKYSKSDASSEKKSLSTISVIESKVKGFIAPMFFVFGVLAFAYSVIMPQRTITSLTLLKGGNHVKIETYAFMNLKRSFQIPIEQISCARARDVKLSTHNQMTLKVKDRMLYFQLDKKNGKFIEPTLFDFAVGLKRF